LISQPPELVSECARTLGSQINSSSALATSGAVPSQ
jgi:hypothetical protein